MSNQRAQTPDPKAPYIKYPNRTHKAVLYSAFFGSADKPQQKHSLNPYLQTSPPKTLPKRNLFDDEEGQPRLSQQKLTRVDPTPQRNPFYNPNEEAQEYDDDPFASDFDFRRYLQAPSSQRSLPQDTPHQKNTTSPFGTQPIQYQVKGIPHEILANINKTAPATKSTNTKKVISDGKGYAIFNTKKVEPPLMTKLKAKSKNPTEAQVLAYKDLVDNKIKNLHSLDYEEIARVVYNKELFVHVCDAPSLIASNWRALGKYLNAPCKHDLQRAWVLFLWIVQNLSIDPEALLEEQTQKIDDMTEIFSNPTTIGQGFAFVFKSIGQEMGLKVRIIEGYCKGFTYETGSTFKAKNHCWNVVDIEGKSHLIDCMMGSGHIDMSYQYVKELDLFYFLTSPEKLLMTHFPEFALWQLVDKPITKESFEKAAHVYPKYFDFCVDLISHKTSVVDINSEEVEFLLRTLTNVQLFAEICEESVLNRLDSAVFTKYQGDGIYKFDVLFPHTGTYYLRIFGLDKQSKQKSRHLVISYKLNVKFKLERNQIISPGLMRKYPRVNPKYFHGYNIEMVSHQYAIEFHQVKQQPLMVALSCAEDVILSAVLCRGEDNEILEGYTYTQADIGFFEFHLLFPKAGHYFFSIYAYHKGTKEKNFIIEYPIAVTSEDKGPIRTFLEMNIDNCMKFKARPYSHRFNVRFEDREERYPRPLSLYFTADMFTTFNFSLYASDKSSEILRDYCFYDVVVNNDDVLHRVDVVFPKTGAYCLEVYCKYMFPEKENEDFFFFVMKYKIDAMVAIPKQNIGFATSYMPGASLHSPREKYLSTKVEHLFSVSIPKKPMQVMLQVPEGYGNDKIVSLSQQKDPEGNVLRTYEVRVRIPFQGEVMMFAQFSSNEVPIKMFKFIAVDE